MPSMSDHQLLDRVSIWLATGLGVGLVAPAPGTIGGLWGLPLVCALGKLDTAQQAAVLAVLILLSVGICTLAARAMGMGKDPGAIVLDEILSLPIVFLGVPTRDAATLIAGFLVFRVMDISKPWPIRRLERLPRGLGVMADDVLAGVFACGLLHGLQWLDRIFVWGMFSTAA